MGNDIKSKTFKNKNRKRSGGPEHIDHALKALVRFLARRAAERDYAELLAAREAAKKEK